MTLKNLNKSRAITEEWLTNGELPLGSTWGDLYTHVIDKSPDISKDTIFTGYIAFSILTKYSEDGSHGQLPLLSTENDLIHNVDLGYNKARKHLKFKRMVNGILLCGLILLLQNSLQEG